MLGVSGGTKEDEKREEEMKIGLAGRPERAAAVSHAGGLMLVWHRKFLRLLRLHRDSTSCGGSAAPQKAAAASDSTPSVCSSS